MMLTLSKAIGVALVGFRINAVLRHRGKWQAIDMSRNPAAATWEVVGHDFAARLNGRKLAYYQEQIQPDLPWADDHFAERVSGQPLNPPPSEAWWPHAPGGNAAFKEEKKFSHTYPERLWPKYASEGSPGHMWGIRYPYGDLGDVVEQLRRDPLTRQAYVPIFFPEDTGATHSRRVPCTLGYHLLRTDDKLDIFYYIRSCDLLRHWRNDIYFAVRLLLWVLEQLQWPEVEPGVLRMYASSLHCFRNDYRILFGEAR